MRGDQPVEAPPRRRQQRAGDRGAGKEGCDADAAKARAVREVLCAAAAGFAGCPHRRRSSPRFVDWYLLLAVGESASEDVVRRRYRQLALQLHPDKNRHPKAEVAFKFVSEAHACLTDKARRRAFDTERRASFSAVCHDRHALSSPSPQSSGTEKRTAAAVSACGATAQPASAAAMPRARRPPAAPAQALRDVQNRMRDECRVIDRCLRANNAAACARRRQSFPLFDPSDRCSFPDYPHTRPPLSPFGGVELRRFEEHLAGADQNQRWCRSGGESPVYEIRTAPPERTAAGTCRSC